jgi:hypothetical protein
MSGARAVTASFELSPPSYTLVITRSGDGAGTVTSTPGGITCGSDCSESYIAGTLVTLTPTPAGGSVFVGWSGACSGTGPCQITMNGARSADAAFALAMYPLNVSVSGTGSGTVTSSPPGIDCGADCAESYNRGTVVSLAATPASGSSFGGWSGACSGSGACQVTLNAARSVAATFVAGGPPPPRGDFDRDGRPDLLWRHNTSGSLYAWFLVNGQRTSGAYLEPDKLGSRGLQVRGLADLNRDTHTDLLLQDEKTGALSAWLMNGTNRTQTVTIPAIGLPNVVTTGRGPARRSTWRVAGLADINQDGSSDIVWRHPRTGALYVWLMNGATPTSGASFTPDRFADTNWHLRGLSDFNGDGKVDLLWHHQTTGDLYVWFMNGTGAVGAAYLRPSRFADVRWQLERVQDLNNDGKPDLLWRHQSSDDLYVWYMNGVVAQTAGYLDPSKPSDARWAIAPQ